MKKKIFIIAAVFVFLLSISLYSSEIELFISGGYSPELEISSMNYNWVWGEDWIDISENGSINLSALKCTSFSAGATKFLSKNFGISFFVDYLKRDINLNSQYSMSLVWYDGESEILDGNWNNTESITIIPIGFSLVYRVFLTESTFINISSGLNLNIIKLNLNSNIGYADILEDDLYYYRDWYDLNVQSSKDILTVGLNVGIEIEQKITDNIGLNIGFKFIYMSDIYTLWNVLPKSEFIGEQDLLTTTEIPDIHFDSNLSQNLKLSYERFFVGIKIYL